MILTLGPLHVTGTAGFALTKSTVDADVDGSGAADLMGATLTALALDVTALGVSIEDVATLTVSGKLAIAMLKPAVKLVDGYAQLVGAEDGQRDGLGRSGPVLGIGVTATIAVGCAGSERASSTQPRAGVPSAGLGARVRSGWRRAVR